MNHEELYRIMRRCYDDLIEFVATPGFRRVHQELYALEPTERPRFVEEVLLNHDQLKERGVEVPPGILILRSSFGDRRPTLFCVKKYLPKEAQSFWQNVNLTFDNDYEDKAVPRDEQAWRRPLPVAVQSLMMSEGVSAEQLEVR